MPVSYRIVLLQCAATLIVAGCMALVSLSQASAALYAGLVTVVPGAWFAWVASRPGQPAAAVVAKGFTKLVVMAVAMAVVFRFARPEALGFFSALAVQSLMYVVGGIWLQPSPGDPEYREQQTHPARRAEL